jgi:nicotinamidase-related amidase
MEPVPAGSALVLIDLQQAIDAPYWGPRNNQGAEAVIARVLSAWRAARRPVFHVRHDSRDPNSAYLPGLASHAFKPDMAPQAGETVVAKSTCSAFVRTDLQARLGEAAIDTLFVMGVLTQNSLEATARHAGDLGFATHVVADGCWAVDKRLRDGRIIAAELVHELSLANLDGEYAEIIEADALLARLALDIRPD